MRRSHRTALAAAIAGVAVAAVAGSGGGPAGAAGDPGYTMRTLHFAVRTGPGGHTPCDIVGDLYTPTGAGPAHRVPAILTTNGFGGSKDDQAGIGTAFAARGYAVLSYSGLGFGGSGCKITLDDPGHDGHAARQLVSFLGGAPGIAFADAQHTRPVARYRDVVHDATDHTGTPRAHDPRVGMIGGSYGGEIQFATASVDPRVDTIVPLITWNDLSYSLAPNNTDRTHGVSTSTPGATKLTWGLGFSAEGVADGVAGAGGNPSRLFGCPNFADFVCPALVTGGTTGYFQPDAIRALRHASVEHYMPSIRIPTLLIQGENDTLFNLNEAVATYRSLRAQGTPVTMIWQSWGHSDLTPAPGELDLANPDPATQYETARIAHWFDHYLKGRDTGTGPTFAYFRDWVHYTGIATPAYATAPAFPVGTRRTWYLSGDGRLVGSRSAVRTGSQVFATPPAGAPTSLDPADVVGSYAPAGVGDTDRDAPGTYAVWDGTSLRHPLHVAGIPVLRVRLDAPTAAASQGAGPAGQLVVFAKLRDVAADGTARLIRGQVAPVRVPDVTKDVTIRLPGIVHEFPAGHHLELAISGGSENYRGGLSPTPVSIAGDAGETLRLPVT